MSNIKNVIYERSEFACAFMYLIFSNFAVVCIFIEKCIVNAFQIYSFI